MLFGGLLELELVLAYDAIFFLFVCYAYEYDVMSFFFFFFCPCVGCIDIKKYCMDGYTYKASLGHLVIIITLSKLDIDFTTYKIS